MELISSEYYKNSTLRLQNVLENSVQRINEGSELGKEVTLIGNFCQNEFDAVRKMANTCFQKWINEEKVAQESKMRNLINEKKNEIKELRDTIKSLSNVSTPLSSENLRIYEEERRIAEEKVKRKQQDAIFIAIPEMITKDQVDVMLENVYEELKDMKEEIQMNAKDIQEAFNQTKIIFKCNTKALVSSLKGQFNKNLKDIASMYEEKTKNINEAHEAEKAILQKMIEEIKKHNRESERKRELQRLVYSVYTSNPDNSFIKSHSLIRNNLYEIKNIWDIFERRKQVQDIYNKISLFTGLFGREDLGIKMQISHLNIIKSWLDQTEKSRVLAYYGISGFTNYRVNGYHNENDGWDCPSYRVHEVNGRNLEGNLPNAIERLRSMTNSNIQAKTRLEEIVHSTIAAENRLKIEWNHPPWYGNNTNQLRYWENDQQLGRFFHEYGGKYWMTKEGFLGSFNRPSWIRQQSGDARELWNSQFVTRFNTGIDNIENAIIQRVKLLFDFETNPDSPFQMIYKNLGQTNPVMINFPYTEMDTLINQCNELIKIAL